MRNRGHVYRSRAQAPGFTLGEWLSRAYPHTSAGGWRARIEAGEVEVECARAHPDDPLLPGQLVTWARPAWDEPEVPLSFDVLHEDGHVLAVHKPSGLPCLPAGGFLEHTLLALVTARFPGASPVHRLGRGTSGVVLFARTDVARRSLNAGFRDGLVEKTYRALASGPIASPLSIQVPIGPVPHPLLGTVFAASAAGKCARSTVVPIASRGEHTLVDVDIETGRPHQIRIHLAAAGHPLVGDPLYGEGGLPRSSALPGDGGYALHALRVAFVHPASGERVAIAAPAPELLRP